MQAGGKKSLLPTFDVYGLQADIVDATTQSGRHDLNIITYGRLLPDDGPEILSIVAHGDPFMVGGKTPERWAQQLIDNYITADTKEIVFMSCNVGRGDNSFIDKLYQALKKAGYDLVVRGPTGFYNVRVYQDIPIYGPNNRFKYDKRVEEATFISITSDLDAEKPITDGSEWKVLGK